MSFQHPAHYNYQVFTILQSGVICATATFIGILDSILGLTMFFLSLFSSCFMYYNYIRSVASHDTVVSIWLPNTSVHMVGIVRV